MLVTGSSHRSHGMVAGLLLGLVEFENKPNDGLGAEQENNAANERSRVKAARRTVVFTRRCGQQVSSNHNATVHH